MITELGHFSLILAFSIACIQAVALLLGAQMRWSGWMSIALPAATLQFMLTAVAFIALTWSFVNSDFSVRLVTLNSHSLKPMLYKVTGVWGNHEGSMLLWVLIVTLFGAFAAWFGGNLPPLLRARVLGIQALIGAAFFAFILFTSNPFERILLPPFDGQDLNPLLQDPGLAFHPPFLYLGYVGLSMTYSFAVAALLEGKVEAAWGRWVRPYTLAAWVFLTVGIGLGSWWAYYELGWGGFWFWDPVENASFMPWLVTAALLHCAIVVEKREALKSWTILLAIVAFGFSMIGAFLTRSGVITSVHAFASDPERGVFLLLILAIFMFVALILFASRAGAMHSKSAFSVASRESALVLNNVLLAISAFVVFIGTIWPLISEMLFDRKLSVGPPFFNMAFTPFMMALVLILPVGAMLPWKRARMGRILRQLFPAFVLAMTILALLWTIQMNRSILGPLGVALGAWLIAGSMTEIWSRSNGNAARALRFPRADWGKAVAHCGLGVTIAGIAGLMAWEVEDIRVMNIDDEMFIAGYSISFKDVVTVNGPNYMATRGEFTLSRNGRTIGNLYPEKRTYPVADISTTEAAINNGFFRDMYVVIGDRQHDGGWAVRTYYKPLANWIWGGAILMALGGMLSLSDRRHRVAAGVRRMAVEEASAS